MYKILSNQKKRVLQGKYNKDDFAFLVEQAFEKGKITQEERDELITFEDDE